MTFPLDLSLWRWLQSLFMAQRRERNNFAPRTACVSPLWKHSTPSNVVTLRMRPPQTPFTSLDTFMAAHSPRRFCQARQKCILSKCGSIFSLRNKPKIARKVQIPLHLPGARTRFLITIKFLARTNIIGCLFFPLEEPLAVDKRITDTGYAPVQQKKRNDSGWVYNKVLYASDRSCDGFRSPCWESSRC